VRIRELEKFINLGFQKSLKKQRKQYEKTTKQLYAEFLHGTDWDYFCTFTTSTELTVNSARRAAEIWYDRVRRVCGSFYQPSMFWVAEPFDCKEGYHIHALVTLPDHFTYSDMAADWSVATGVGKMGYINEVYNIDGNLHYTRARRGAARCHFERYIKGRGANSYLGKYLQKKRCDYDFYGSLRK